MCIVLYCIVVFHIISSYGILYKYIYIYIYMVTPPRADSSSWGGVFSCFFLLPCFHRGDIEARMGKPRQNHVLQSVVFSFFVPSLLPQG